MLRLKSFCFNPFSENTYVLYNDDSEAWIIDPGNSTASENRELADFIEGQGLRPVRLLLTHGHIDHVMGNRFVFDRYGLKPVMHRDDLVFIDSIKQSAAMYGVSAEASPRPDEFIEADTILSLGNYTFQCILAPGHSPGSVCYYNSQNKLLIAGDVLFQGSIGRADLPMGDYDTLIASITGKLLPLGDDVKVYPGHGPSTTIGAERKSNPFLAGIH